MKMPVASEAHTQSVEQVLARLGSSRDGLTRAEAARRLARQRHLWRTAAAGRPLPLVREQPGPPAFGSWGPTQKLLGLEPVSAELWLAMFGISSSVFAAVELHKLWLRWRSGGTGRDQTFIRSRAVGGR